MRKRTSNSKPASSSRASNGGSSSFRKTNDGADRPFKKARPEAESRFSKPSIKKSSLRVAAGSSENRGPSARPSFDHEKPKSDRPRFDKPDFKKYGSDRDKPRPFKRDDDSRGGAGKTGPDRYAKSFKPKGDFKPGEKRTFGDRPERPRFERDNGPRDFKPREDSREFKPRDDSRGFKPREDSREFKPREDSRGERRPFEDRPERPRFEKDNGPREFKPRDDSRGERKSFGDRPERPRPERNDGSREFKPRDDSREFKPREEFRGERKSFGDRPERPRPETNDGPREFKPRENARLGHARPGHARPGARRSFGDKPVFKKKDESDFSGERNLRERPSTDENVETTEDRSGLDRRVGRFESAPRYNLSGYEKKNSPRKKEDRKEEGNEIRLNRYIANAGICSRREADDLISSGQISVNGKTITEMGYKVMVTDVVKYGKKALNPEKMVYILVNKPKDYITTTDDPEDRKTILDLIKGACFERVYPVGRLDRNTTGLLLLTNDGELAAKLTHPSGGIKKIYQAELDKPITTEDFERLQHGLELEDGFIHPDEVGIVTPDAMVVGLEIHSGRNRIVRRMFEHLGYEVQKLDRTVFAGLDKKDLPRGKWRFLSEKEVIKLKFML